MSWEVMEQVLEMARKVGPTLLDITGGAPELNPSLRRFIVALRQEKFPVQVRTNLTVLLEEGMEDFPEFYRDYEVRLVASLPCYLKENVQKQRGDGVYDKSIEVIRRLNERGYGRDPRWPLLLVYNPGGAFLAGDQAGLEADYKRELWERFGIVFTNLITINNMPLGRFRQQLQEDGQEEDYLQLLQDFFNPQTLDALMCRHQISVGWDGTLYDCDFNLALGLAVDHGAPDHLSRFEREPIEQRQIVTGLHCFGCTAGCGSSCSGALL